MEDDIAEVRNARLEAPAVADELACRQDRAWLLFTNVRCEPTPLRIDQKPPEDFGHLGNARTIAAIAADDSCTSQRVRGTNDRQARPGDSFKSDLRSHDIG